MQKNDPKRVFVYHAPSIAKTHTTNTQYCVYMRILCSDRLTTEAASAALLSSHVDIVDEKIDDMYTSIH